MRVCSQYVNTECSACSTYFILSLFFQHLPCSFHLCKAREAYRHLSECKSSSLFKKAYGGCLVTLKDSLARLEGILCYLREESDSSDDDDCEDKGSSPATRSKSYTLPVLYQQLPLLRYGSKISLKHFIGP